MQMFQSLSRQSNELSIAITAHGLELYCLRHYIKLIGESPNAEEKNFHPH